MVNDFLNSQLNSKSLLEDSIATSNLKQDKAVKIYTTVVKIAKLPKSSGVNTLANIGEANIITSCAMLVPPIK